MILFENVVTVSEKLRGGKKNQSRFELRENPRKLATVIAFVNTDSTSLHFAECFTLHIAMSLADVRTLHCTGPVLHSVVAETQSSTGDACPTCVTPVARTHAHPLRPLHTPRPARSPFLFSKPHADPT